MFSTCIRRQQKQHFSLYLFFLKVETRLKSLLTEIHLKCKTNTTHSFLHKTNNTCNFLPRSNGCKSSPRRDANFWPWTVSIAAYIREKDMVNVYISWVTWYKKWFSKHKAKFAIFAETLKFFTASPLIGKWNHIFSTPFPICGRKLVNMTAIFIVEVHLAYDGLFPAI